MILNIDNICISYPNFNGKKFCNLYIYNNDDKYNWDNNISGVLFPIYTIISEINFYSL